MNQEDIEKIVSVANDAVKDLEGPLKIEGFKLILNKLLETGLKSETESYEEEIPGNESGNGHDDPLPNLAKICACSKSDLMNILDYENDNFVLLKKVEGTSLTEKVQNSSLCILTAWMKGKGVDWVDATTLASALYNSGISNADVGKKLRKKGEYFSMKGKVKGAKYRLTAPGWQKGIEIIKSLL